MLGVSAGQVKKKVDFDLEMGSLGWSFFSDSSGDSVPFVSGGSDYSEFRSVSDNGGLTMSDGNFCSEGTVFESCGGGVDLASSLNGFVGSCSSPRLEDLIGALQKYLPSNNEDEEGSLTSVDAYSCDEFRMYEFKVRRCMRGRSHDWTECPFAHPGEKARRRDPRRFHYSGTACPDFRKGACRRGDACEFAHGVFECWLHPARYRTQPCKDGRNCKRRVCFFAHTTEQLRLLPSISSPQASSGSYRSALALALHASAVKNSLCASYDGSPRRHLMDGLVECSNHSPDSASTYFTKAVLSSPTSTLVGHAHSPPPLSPPLSPSVSPPESPNAWLNCSGNSRTLKAFQKPGFSPSALAQIQSSTGNVGFAQSSSPRRHHLERMASMPAVTFPSSPSRHVVYTGPSSPSTQPNKSMAELMDSFQSMELNSTWQTAQLCGVASHGSPRGSNLRHCVTGGVSCSPRPSLGDNLPEFIPNPKSCYGDISSDFKPKYGENLADFKASFGDNLTEFRSSCGDNMSEHGDNLAEAKARLGIVFEEPAQRVESGRDLRAKIYGRLSNKSLQEPLPSEASPDLGWVNELVK